MNAAYLLAPSLLALLASLALPRFARLLTGAGSALVALFAAAALMQPERVALDAVTLPWFPAAGLAFALEADAVSLALVALAGLLVAAVALSGWSALLPSSDNARARSAVLGVTLLAATLNFLASDALLFYASFELALVPAWMVLYSSRDAATRKTALPFMAYTFAGSLAMLVALVWVALRRAALSGSALTFDIHALTDTILPLGEQYIALLALLAAFAVKMPLAGVHGWLPQTYAKAPAPLVALLTGLLSKLGAYGLYKLALPLFPSAAHRLGPTLVVIALVGGLYAAVCALRQSHTRGVLAYSSIAHLALLPLGLFSMRSAGLDGFLLLMLSHGLSAAALFLLVAFLEQQQAPLSLDASSLRGLATPMPRLAVAFVFFSMASAALPGTANFVAEFLVFAGGFTSLALYPWSIPFVLTALVGVVLAAVYGLSLVRRLLFGDYAGAEGAHQDLRLRDAGGLLLLGAFTLLLGLAPSQLQSATRETLTSYRVTFQGRLQKSYLNDAARVVALRAPGNPHVD